MAAADHAAAAAGAAGPLRALAAEVRVGDDVARLVALPLPPKKTATFVDSKPSSAPDLLPDVADHLVRGRQERGPRRPEHPERRRVVGRELLLPVARGRPHDGASKKGRFGIGSVFA